MRHQNFGTFEVSHHLELVNRRGVGLHAEIQSGNVAFQIFLHPNRVLRNDKGARLWQFDLDRLVTNGVAWGSNDLHCAVTEQVVAK